MMNISIFLPFNTAQCENDESKYVKFNNTNPDYIQNRGYDVSKEFTVRFGDDRKDLSNLNNLFIRLPQYQQTFLTALQNRGDGGIFTAFDNDPDLCVIDNCANVHI